MLLTRANNIRWKEYLADLPPLTSWNAGVIQNSVSQSYFLRQILHIIYIMLSFLVMVYPMEFDVYPLSSIPCIKIVGSGWIEQFSQAVESQKTWLVVEWNCKNCFEATFAHSHEIILIIILTTYSYFPFLFMRILILMVLHFQEK
jgi:hypothetical protein